MRRSRLHAIGVIVLLAILSWRFISELAGPDYGLGLWLSFGLLEVNSWLSWESFINDLPY